MPDNHKAWQTRAFGPLARMLAALPLRVNHTLGALIGWVAWASRSSLREISEINVELCFPDIDASARDRLVRDSLAHTGRALTECAWIGLRSRAEVERHMRVVSGGELFDRAKDEARGLIVATPHLGTWELCNLPISGDGPITYLYRSPRKALLESHLIEWRRNLGGLPARLDPSGIRSVLKELQAGRIVGVLPDQEPDPGAGIHAPFFEIPAYTMTLLAKLARRTRSTVLFCVSERRSGEGWHVHFLEPDADIADDDPGIAAAALNRTVERCIALCPEQYSWSYKRFRQQPDGTRRLYRRQDHLHAGG